MWQAGVAWTDIYLEGDSLRGGGGHRLAEMPANWKRSFLG